MDHLTTPLCKHLKTLPTGFTFNYVYQFHRGTVTIKHLASDDASDALTYNLLKRDDYDRTKKEMWQELFGSIKKEEVHHKHVRLPVHPTREIDPSKIKSLGKKYHTIPADKRSYYPPINEDDLINDEGDDVSVRDGIDETRETRREKGKKKTPKKRERDPD